MKLRPGILVGGLCFILVAVLLASYGGSLFGGAESDGGLISITQAAVASSFQILATTPVMGTNTEAVAVSPDGQVVVGKYFLSGSDPNCQVFGGCTRSFIWTAATGVQDLGTLGTGRELLAYDLSSDGSLVVGEASSQIAYRRAAIWTAAIGVQDLGTPFFPNDPDHSTTSAYSVSGDGSVIVGRAVISQTSLIPHSFRFTNSGGYSVLQPQLANELQGEGDGVSGDGSTVVGISYDQSSFLGRAFRWKAGAVQNLGNLGGGVAYGKAASSDGSVVVGQSFNSNGKYDAFRWTASGGIKDLGNLGGGSAAGSFGQDVSADGSVVVGTATVPGVSRAYRWTSSRGIEDLNTVMTNQGVSLNGYQIVFADAVSADGTVVVGMAENAALGVDAAYRLVMQLPACAKVTCASLGKNCGSISDGCGGTVTCGTCGAPATCGGGGKANVCGGGCTQTTCAAQGKNCGAMLDGCGGWIACGDCASPQLCGGEGVANVCGTPPPIVQNLTFNPNPVVGGNNTTGTVTLTLPAPSGGAIVTLSCSNTSVNTCPASVSVPSGQTSVNFTATTSPPPQDTVSMNAACLNGQCYNMTLYVTAACVPAVCMTGNCGSMGNGCGGTLNCGACPSGQVCTNNTCNLPCTPTTCAAQGKNCGSIPDGCGGTLSCGTCTAPQTCGGGGTPNVCGSPSTSSLSSLTLNPTSVTGGSLSTGTATLSGAAPSGGVVVSLSSNNSVATVPSSVTVPAGATSKTFSVTTQTVTATTTAVITGTAGGVSRQASLSVTPAGAVTLSSLTLNPTSVKGGDDSQGTVRLSGPAPSGGTVVSLSSSNTSVATVPASVTVAAGQTSRTFSVSTQRRSSNSSVNVLATYGGVTKTAALTVTGGR